MKAVKQWVSDDGVAFATKAACVEHERVMALGDELYSGIGSAPVDALSPGPVVDFSELTREAFNEVATYLIKNYRIARRGANQKAKGE